MPKRLTQDVSVAAAIFLFAMLATAIVLIATPARAAFSGGAGLDYQAGPEAQSCRGALLFASADMEPGDLTLAAIRYEDSTLGPGIGGFANAGVRVAPSLRLRAIGLRTLGDRGFDAWRLRAGPEVVLTPDVTLGAYYLRLHDGSPERFAAAGVELSLPVCPGLSGQVGSSYGRWSGGATTAQGTVAAMWRAAAPLQLLCEVDVGRNVTTTTSTNAPSGGGIWSGLPLANRPGSESSSESRTENRITSVAQFGIRYLFP